MTAITVRDKDARDQTQQLKADAAEAERMLQLHQEIMGAGLTLLEKAKTLGDLLATKKVEVGHGGWSSWCRQYLPQMTQRQASNYIRISENWETVLRQYRQQSDDNLSLRGAIAYLQEAANSDHPGKEEIMRIWAEAIDARFSGRRGKYPIVVDVADPTFGQQFSFPKSFQTWKHTWEHWQQKGQAYTEGLTRIRQERAQATQQEEAIEQAPVKLSSRVVPFVSPEAIRIPSDNFQVQTHGTPHEGPAMEQRDTVPTLFLDHQGQELEKGDRVVFYNDPGLAGTITGIDWTADRKHFAVLWDGDKDWVAYRGGDLKKIAPSEEPQYGEIRDDTPQVEVQVLPSDRITPWAETYSGDKLSENKIRGMFAWAGHQWVCTAMQSIGLGSDGLKWLKAVKLVPLDEWYPRETLDYKGICDRRHEQGFSYEGLLIIHNRKKWVLTGEEIEFRPEEIGNTVSNSEPEPIFEYDDYVTGPDRTGVIRTGWVIEAGYTTMFVTDDAGKAAYDMGATRQQLENCWAMDQATAEHCEPEGYSLEDAGAPAIDVEAKATHSPLPPIGTRGKHGGRPGVWVTAHHSGTGGVMLWNSCGKMFISASEFTAFDDEPSIDNLKKCANSWLGEMCGVLGTVEVIHMALTFASPQELKTLSENLSPEGLDQLRNTIEAAIAVGGQVLGTGTVYSMARKQHQPTEDS